MNTLNIFIECISLLDCKLSSIFVNNIRLNNNNWNYPLKNCVFQVGLISFCVFIIDKYK